MNQSRPWKATEFNCSKSFLNLVMTHRGDADGAANIEHTILRSNQILSRGRRGYRHGIDPSNHNHIFDPSSRPKSVVWDLAFHLPSINESITAVLGDAGNRQRLDLQLMLPTNVGQGDQFATSCRIATRVACSSIAYSAATDPNVFRHGSNSVRQRRRTPSRRPSMVSFHLDRSPSWCLQKRRHRRLVGNVRLDSDAKYLWCAMMNAEASP